MRSRGISEWAQGSLRLLTPPELLELLGRRRFSGRLTLISTAPRQVVALLIEGGRPRLVLGSGVDADAAGAAGRHRARQVLLEALAWRVGTFRVDVEPGHRDLPAQPLGEIDELLAAASERERIWPRLLARLPAPVDEVMVAPRAGEHGADGPVQAAVLAAVSAPRRLREIPDSCGIDDHVAIAAVLALAETGAILLGTAADVAPPRDPRLAPLVRDLLDLLQPDGRARSLKVTVLSWDAATCFRAVEALCGRDRRPPANADAQPRFQILHESCALGDGYRLEVLAFRADTFEPTFAAPLVQDCHVFLIFTDVDSGHGWGSERPLVERLNEVRSMFRGASVAARVTVGGGAVTDPGSDVILPEISRHLSWSELLRPAFMPGLLRRVAERLGVDAAEPVGRPLG